MSFEFATAARVIFGDGVRAQLPTLLATMGRRPMVVTGARGLAGLASVAAPLQERALIAATVAVAHEPTIAEARDWVARARDAACDCVVAVGGGSVIDAGKAVAALLGNGGDPVDYLEVVGAGKPFARPSVPFVAVPTTAGTGAEVTRNAVLTSTEHGVKASLRGPQLLPAVALVDPELTWSMPPALTATTGLDALAQLLEPFVSVRASPLTDAICREGLPRVARALPRAFANGNDREARREMALASLLSGMALANAGLGAAHGFAGPLGGRFRAPHGALCACLLPGVMRVNRAALAVRGDAAGGRSAERFDELARLLTGRHDAEAADGERFVIDIVNMLCIPSLRSYGIAAADVDLIVPQAAAASSMKGNPIVLTADELREIFVSAW